MKKIQRLKAHITILVILGMLTICLAETTPILLVSTVILFLEAGKRDMQLQAYKDVYSNAGEDRPE